MENCTAKYQVSDENIKWQNLRKNEAVVTDSQEFWGNLPLVNMDACM